MINLLIEDIGGHGRALESLERQLMVLDLQTTSFSLMMHNIRVDLEMKYPDWLEHASQYKNILLAILVGYRFPSPTDLVPGTPFTVDHLVSLGLIRWNRGDQVLSTPYIWLWLLSSASHDNLLNRHRFDVYQEQKHLLDDETDTGAQVWPHWEEFNAHFRCLKAELLKGQNLSWRSLHCGAKCWLADEKTDDLVEVKPLKCVKACHQASTKSPMKTIETMSGQVTISDCNTLILCAAGNPSGDAFCGVRLVNSPKPVVHEVQQDKCFHTHVSNVKYREEWAKSATPDRDFFILFTTNTSSVILPPRCAIVDQSCFRAYYGPFAARAFFAALPPPKPHINDPLSKYNLESLYHIGPKRAEKILSKRPFRDLDDALTRTQIPRSILTAVFDFEPKKAKLSASSRSSHSSFAGPSSTSSSSSSSTHT